MAVLIGGWHTDDTTQCVPGHHVQGPTACGSDTKQLPCCHGRTQCTVNLVCGGNDKTHWGEQLGEWNAGSEVCDRNWAVLLGGPRRARCSSAHLPTAAAVQCRIEQINWKALFAESTRYDRRGCAARGQITVPAWSRARAELHVPSRHVPVVPCIKACFQTPADIASLTICLP